MFGTAAITVGGDGFKGTLGNMTLASAATDENTGILSGTLKMSYFDAKTGKIKTKSIKIGGVTADGEAVGSATIKGQATKSFSAEVEVEGVGGRPERVDLRGGMGGSKIFIPNGLIFSVKYDILLLSWMIRSFRQCE